MKLEVELFSNDWVIRTSFDLKSLTSYVTHSITIK